jgi:23S rRNA (adenine2503-C2)-methyltransferase
VYKVLPDLAPPATALERLPEEWSAQLEAWGEPKYRGKQVFEWLHKKGVLDPNAMTNLPKSLRERLATDLVIDAAIQVSSVHDSDDGTKKLLLATHDGRTSEAVLIPMPSAERGDLYAAEDPSGEDAAEAEAATGTPTNESVPVTQCISTQIGCAMGCVFCASGLAGLKRHMSAGEIVGQVIQGRAHTAAGHRLRNVVFMGMGEPLHNYAAVARALTLLTHPDGLALSKRRVTISTSGLVPEIDRLGRDFGGEVQLAVSLHSPDDAQRSEIMPINKKHPLPELMEALRRYPLPKRRRITIEYTLIRGFNASPTDAKKLSELLRGLPVKVNLIPLNRVEGNPLEPPSWDDVDAFQAVLRDRGVANFVRRRKGDDIAAACGQLALRNEPKKIRVALPQLRD